MCESTSGDIPYRYPRSDDDEIARQLPVANRGGIRARMVMTARGGSGVLQLTGTSQIRVPFGAIPLDGHSGSGARRIGGSGFYLDVAAKPCDRADRHAVDLPAQVREVGA